MRPPSVQSFGRRTEPENDVAPVMLPPVQMPPIQLPVVLVVDAAALAAASEQITEMVTQAVRTGLMRAIEDLEGGQPAVLDEPEPNLDQLGYLTQ